MNDNPEVLPREFCRRLKTLVSSADYECISAAFAGTRPTTLRANTLKIKPAELAGIFTKYGIGFRQPVWSGNAFILDDTTVGQLTDLPEHKNGQFYIQSLSSMLPPLVLNPQPGEKILDMAAAPGSKTTQMAAMMQNRGSIISVDTSRTRIYRLKANLVMQGVSCVTVIQKPGQIIWKDYPEYFDRALVDVPCSMEGRFNTTIPKTYDSWTPKKVKMLSESQKWMLRSAVSAVKPGGYIVYSTCTLAPEENEQVIDWIYRKEKGAVDILPLNLQVDELKSGITSVYGRNLDYGIKNTGRIYPSLLFEGFYIALLKKNSSTVPF